MPAFTTQYLHAYEDFLSVIGRDVGYPTFLAPCFFFACPISSGWYLNSICLFNICVCPLAHTCHGVCVGQRRMYKSQFFPSTCGAWDQTQVISFSSKHLYLLGHLVTLRMMFVMVGIFLKSSILWHMNIIIKCRCDIVNLTGPTVT